MIFLLQKWVFRAKSIWIIFRKHKFSSQVLDRLTLACINFLNLGSVKDYGRKKYQVERTTLIIKYITCLEHGKEPAGAGRACLWKAKVGNETEEALDFALQQLKIFDEWCNVIFIMLCLGIQSLRWQPAYEETIQYQVTNWRPILLTKQEIRRWADQSSAASPDSASSKTDSF